MVTSTPIPISFNFAVKRTKILCFVRKKNLLHMKKIGHGRTKVVMVSKTSMMTMKTKHLNRVVANTRPWLIIISTRHKNSTNVVTKSAPRQSGQEPRAPHHSRPFPTGSFLPPSRVSRGVWGPRTRRSRGATRLTPCQNAR